MKGLDLIIPAYNEELRIRATLDDYLTHLGEEVVLTVVINNTTDNTRGVVEEFQERFPKRVQIIEEKGFTDKGGAILLGWKGAKRELIGFADADGATSAREIQKMLKQMGDADGVIGSRFLPKSKIVDRNSTIRRAASKILIFLVQKLLRLPYSDFQCGAKIFTREAIQDIMPQITLVDMSFDTDLLWHAHRRGWKIVEVPIVWFERTGSATLDSKVGYFKTSLKMFLSILKLAKRRGGRRSR